MITALNPGATMTKRADDRFWPKVDRRGHDECWLWLGSKNRKGYGRMCVEGRYRFATHLSLEFDGRPRPVGLFALHSCDNSACVNPRHLRWDTHAENMVDAANRKRFAVGERNGQARLTAEQVREIRASSLGKIALAKKFGVVRQTIYAVLSGAVWKDVA